MTIEELEASLRADEPPAGARGPLEALWHAAKGNWHKAHEIVQDNDSAAASWVHAYLHRVEGDLANAGYWYAKAGKPPSDAPLDDEWRVIAAQLLAAI